MFLLPFSGASHGIQCPELPVPDQKQHKAPLFREPPQIIGLQRMFYKGLLQISRIALFLLGKRGRIVRIEITADRGRDDHIQKTVVKPGQKFVPVAASLDQLAYFFKATDHEAMVLFAVGGGNRVFIVQVMIKGPVDEKRAPDLLEETDIELQSLRALPQVIVNNMVFREAGGSA